MTTNRLDCRLILHVLVLPKRQARVRAASDLLACFQCLCHIPTRLDMVLSVVDARVFEMAAICLRSDVKMSIVVSSSILNDDLDISQPTSTQHGDERNEQRQYPGQRGCQDAD